MKVFSLKPGLVIEREGHKYQFLRTNMSRRLIFRDEHGETWLPSLADFWQEFSERRVEVFADQPHLGCVPKITVAEADLSFFPPEYQEEALRRRRYLDELLKVTGTLAPNAQLANQLKAIHGAINDKSTVPSIATVRRWWAAFQNSRCTVSLVPLHSKKGSHKIIVGELEDILMSVLEEEYLRLERPSAKFAYQRLVARLTDVNQYRPPSQQLICPSYNSVLRFIDALDPYQVDQARHGKHHAKRKFRSATGTVNPGQILSRWEIDHTLMDILLIDQETGEVIGRPYLTVALDRESRMIMGYWLHLCAPSTESVLRVIERSIIPKVALLAEYPDINGEWPAYGLPLTIVPDNAAEFHSKNLVHAFTELGIGILYPPSRSPQHKGGVERFFRTLAEALVHILPGTTFSNIQKRGDYPSEDRACLTLPQLNRILLRWIVEVYHNTSHRGLGGKTPLQVWNAMQSHRLIHVPADLDQLEAVLACREVRQTFHYGVEVGGVRYNSPELQVIRNRPSSTESVRVHYRDEMSHVWVADEQHKRFIRVPAVDSRVAGLSRDLYETARKMARRHGNKDLSFERVMRAYQEILEEARQAQHDKTLTKRRASARTRIDKSGQPITVPDQPPQPLQQELFHYEEKDLPSFDVHPSTRQIGGAT